MPLGPGYEFRLEEWLARFSLEKAEDRFCGGSDCPEAMATLEQLRARLPRTLLDRPSVPTDAFVFSRGEPPRRDVTKVGGLPYRPSGLPWPTDDDALPLSFLAQYRFAESHDIVGPTPAEMLLVFVTAPELVYEEKPLAFEWQPLGIESLVTPSEVLRGPWDDLPRWWGNRHRTRDWVQYPSREELASNVPAKFLTYWNDDASRSFARVRGMKIGGLPWVTWPHDAEAQTKRGRFLCSLGCHYAGSETPFPFCNVEQLAWGDYDYLDSSDGFSLNIYLTDAGEIDWHVFIA